MINSENNNGLLLIGINQGYILAKENPAYLKDLLKSIRSKNEYTYGLRSGRKLYQQLSAKRGFSI